MSIFADYAPLYWAAGLQVMPLRPRTKRPLLDVWQQWNQTKIPDETKQLWLDRYPDANIGLPAGVPSNICMVDIDTIDPKQLAIIEAILPKSPWRRVGAKGCVLAYRNNGAKSFKIYDSSKKPIVEFFSTSGQVVMPPSIHPDTDRPYVATTNLWEVAGILPELDADIQTLLRKELKLGGVKLDIEGIDKLSSFISVGTRDTTLVKQAGMFARDVERGKMSLREAFDIMSDWIDINTQKVEGDSIDLDKGLGKIVEFLKSDIKKGRVLPKGWDEDLEEELMIRLGLDELDEESLSYGSSEIQQMFLRELKEVEENTPSGPPNYWPVVETTLKRVGRSADVAEFEVDLIIDLIKQHVPAAKVTSLRKALKSFQHSGIEGMNHTEIAQAVLDDLKDFDLRYDQQCFWEWSGSYWMRKDEKEFLNHIAIRYGDKPAAKRASDHSGILKVLQTLIAKPINANNTRGLNFTNGFLTTELRLVDHDPDFGATYEFPFSYRPELVTGGCPRFIKLLDDAWDGDKVKIESLRQAIAVTIFGVAPKFEKCFLLHGVPHSGKSVTLDIVTSLVPQEARASLPPHQLSDKYKVAELAGKIMNQAGELPDNKQIQSDIFKKVVSGQPMTVEKKNKDPFEFRSTAAHWFAANNLPQTRDMSGGFTRRWLIYGFYKEVAEKDRNVNLAEEIIVEERQAIVAWAVESLPEVLRSNKIVYPQDSVSLQAEMSHQINPVRSWYEERVLMEETTTTPEKPAYENYKTWALMKGFPRRDLGEFKRTMRELAGKGLFRCSSNVSGEHTYHGVKLARV